MKHFFMGEVFFLLTRPLMGDPFYGDRKKTQMEAIKQAIKILTVEPAPVNTRLEAPVPSSDLSLKRINLSLLRPL